jgi:hypothetical protein
MRRIFVFFGNQMPLDQHFPVNRFHFMQGKIRAGLGHAGFVNLFADMRFARQSFRIVHARNEMKAANIPRQSNSAGNYNFRLGPAATHPFARRLNHLVQIHEITRPKYRRFADPL